MTVFTVPTSVVNPTSGDVVYLPGHASYADGDISDALLYWLTTNNGGIGTDGFCGMSGHTIQFRNESYALEYGTVWGLAQNQSSYTDRTGQVWPQVKQHAWRDLTIDMNGAEWVQADNTTYDDGLVDGTAATIAGSATVVTLATPLTQSQIDRLRAGTGAVPAISGTKADGTGTLFTRKSGTGGVASRAQIGSCANDGTTVTLAAGNTCNETRAAAPVTIYLGAREPRRNDKLWMFAVGCPGAKGGVERSWMNSNITIGGGTIRMGNTAGATSVFTAREQWHCYRIRAVDGLTIDSTMRGEFIWGDVLNTGQVAQIGVSNATLHAENISLDGIYDTCGRHWITGQGHIGLDAQGVCRDIGRLAWDSETTSSAARVFDTTIHDAVLDPGTVFWHQSPAVFSGEPPRTLSVTTVNGSDRVTVPYDLVNSDDLGASLTGTGIPSGAYVRRRMSPTSLELSAACTASGTITATLGSAVPFREFTCQYVDNWSGAWNLAGNTACAGSRVYFTGTTVEGSNVISNVQWDSRIDGNSYTTADLTSKVFSLGAGLLTANTPSSVTSTTVTMPTVAGYTVDGTDRTVSCIVTANDRTMTTATAFFASSDKGRTVTGTGIRAGTTIASINSAKNVELSQPASSSFAGNITVGGRARFYAQVGPAKWDGYTLENNRNIGNGKWGGSSVVWVAAHQPLILMPEDCTNVTVRKNYMVGARNNSNTIVESGFGYFTSPATTTTGADPASTTTFAQNRFIDMTDNQVSGTPSVTASVSLSGTNLTTARPTLTATVSFSDSRQERGGIVFYRDGTSLQGAAPIVSGTNTATFTPFTDAPTGIHLWTAKWVGSWDTQNATSSSVTQNVGGVSPTTTTTTLTVSPTSPRDAGTSLTLSGTVSPDPGNGSSVAFYDDTTLLGTGTTTSGVATLTTTLEAGSHPLSAQYAGSALYQASTGTSTFVSNAVIVDTTPPTLDAESPVANATDVATDTEIALTFSESVSGLAFVLRLDGQSVSGDLTGSGTGWTFTPTDDLIAGRTYTAILDDCVDSVGNHLAGRVSWTFTTLASAEYIPTGLTVVQPG